MGDFDAAAASKELRLRYAYERAKLLLDFMKIHLPPSEWRREDDMPKQADFEAKLRGILVDAFYAAKQIGFTLDLVPLVEGAKEVYEVDLD